MALKLWASTDGNWDTAASWSPVNKPVASDDILFSPDAGGSNVAATTGNDQTVTNFNTITVDESFTKDIFASGTPLKCTCNVIHYQGAGQFFFQDEDNLSGATDTTDIVICDSPFDSKEAMVLSGNKIDKLIVQAGGVTSNDIAITYAMMVPSLQRFMRGRLSLETSGSNAGITNLTIVGGVYTNTGNVPPTNIWQFGGSVPFSNAMFGTLRVVLGGTSNAGNIAGTLGYHYGNIIALGGKYDYSGLRSNLADDSSGGDFIIGVNATLRRRSDQADPVHSFSGMNLILGKLEVV